MYKEGVHIFTLSGHHGENYNKARLEVSSSFQVEMEVKDNDDNHEAQAHLINNVMAMLSVCKKTTTEMEKSKD